MLSWGGRLYSALDSGLKPQSPVSDSHDFSDTSQPGRKQGNFSPSGPKPNIPGPELLLRALDTLRAQAWAPKCQCPIWIFLIGSIKPRSVFETLNSNNPWKYCICSAVCRKVIHHTEKHEAVLATEGTLLSQWVEMHKIRCRNIGAAHSG